MQMDFHYYATYCAACLAGWSCAESREISYSAQMVDCCSRTLLATLKGPREAATTQLQLELINARTDLTGLQDITRIWASFHFLPYDLCAEVKRASRLYRNKYRLICGPNGALVGETVELAKGKGTQAAGIAVHVLADTWAHRYFAGTPSLVINNTNYYFSELLPGPEGFTERPIHFRHSPSAPDDLEKGLYTNSVYQGSESSVMNLGHGRAGHLPDYSFIRYKYLPAWGGYEELVKDNPSDYFKAFCQMVCAMKYLHGDIPVFETGVCEEEAVEPWAEEIRQILARRQPDACADWKALGEKISGQELEDFELEKYQAEYLDADGGQKDDTFLGSFFLAAMAQKSMVTNRLFRSGNLLAGFSVDFAKRGFRGIGDYRKLIAWRKEGKDA
ncbi:MAG: hypothetical protein IK136_03135 [Oscillospiraceae bacterium]|nr:hypothetical protein [Oscillospiraceae bacterium]